MVSFVNTNQTKMMNLLSCYMFNV